MERATRRVRGDKSEPASALSTLDPIALVETASAETVAEAVSSGRALPRVQAIRNGECIRNVRVIGPGPGIESRDDTTGEFRQLSSWHVAREGNGMTMEVYLIGSYQLDKELPALIGRNVSIFRGEQKEVGSRRVNQFLVVDHGV